MRIDGDALSAARREANRESIIYTFRGVEVEFPAELPYTNTELVQRARDENWKMDRFLPAFLHEALGDEQWKTLIEDARPTYRDLETMFDAVLAAYGTTAGESSSSPASSAPSGDSSKPRPKGSTKPTRSR